VAKRLEPRPHGPRGLIGSPCPRVATALRSGARRGTLPQAPTSNSSKRWAGHSNPLITLKRYSHLPDKRLTDATNQYDPAIRATSGETG
jgi:hypothetical protein